jgi:hypothetical protein
LATKKSAPDQIDTVLAQLWQKNLPTIRERLDLLDQFASAASTGTLDEATRVEALSIAHKLASSLECTATSKDGDRIKMERI